MHTKHGEEIIGETAACDLKKGTSIEWGFVGKEANEGGD